MMLTTYYADHMITVMQKNIQQTINSNSLELTTAIRKNQYFKDEDHEIRVYPSNALNTSTSNSEILHLVSKFTSNTSTD